MALRINRFIYFVAVLIVFIAQTNVFSQDHQRIDSLKKALLVATSDSSKAFLLNQLAHNYFTVDNVKSLQFAQEAFKISSRSGYKYGIGEAYTNIGWVCLNRDSYPAAFKNFRSAIPLKLEGNDKKGVILCYVGLGHTYLGQTNYAEALKCYFKAIKLNDIEGSYSKDALYQCVALVYVEEGNYQEALKYNLESLKIAEAKQRRSSISSININIGDTYLKLNNFTKAQEYFIKSLEMAEEFGDDASKAFALSHLGIIFKSQKYYSKALDYLEEGLKITEVKDQKSLQITILNTMGNIYMIQKEYDVSRLHLNRSLAIARNIGNLMEISNCYFSLSQLDSAQGYNLKSLEEFKLHILYRDSAFNLVSVRKSEQVRMQFEMDKKEVLLRAEQEKKDTISQKELQKQKVVRNAFIGGFVFVLAFASVFLKQRNKISKARKRSDELLLNILPNEVAEELKEKGSAEAKQFDEVTVMFTDFKGFTKITEMLSPTELVSEIHTCFKAFDHIISKHNIEKIKTIGDSYMCAGGLPVPNTTHAVDVVHAALEIQKFMHDQKIESEAAGKLFFEIRIGIHTGPVVAGIVGVKKFAYDIWGDTVNIASRMESSGEAGKINISGTTYEIVKDHFNCIHRGKISAKNKGEIEMYFINHSFSEG